MRVKTAIPAVVLVLLLASLGAAWSAPTPDTGTARYVTTPGFEDVVEKMLKTGAGLPAGWSAVGVSIERERLRASFRGPDRAEASILLEHPSAASAGPTKTAQFALRLAPGAPPGSAALLPAVAASVRAHESGWRWQELAPEEAAAAPEEALEDWARRSAVETVDAAVEAARSGQLDRARQILRGLAELRTTAEPSELPLDLDARIGSAWLIVGDRPEAERHFRDALTTAGTLLARTPDSFPALVLQARAEIGLGTLADPAARTRELATAAPDVAAACDLAALATDLAQLDRVDEALAVFAAILDVRPTCPPATFQLISRVAGEARRLDDVGDLLAKGAALYPDDPEAVGPYANYFKWRKKYDEAIAVLEPLAQTRPPKAGVLEPLLHLYALRGVTPAHIDAFIAKSEADPTDGVSALYAGAFLHYADQHERAIPFLQRARQILPKEPRAYIYLAMSHHALGNEEEARKYIDLAETGGRSDPDVYYCRGRIIMDEDPKRAIENFERYLWETRNAWGLPQSKQERVRKMAERLRSCVDAPVPSECVKAQPDPGEAPPGGHTPQITQVAADWPDGQIPSRESVLALLRGPDGAPFDPGHGWKMATPSIRADAVVLLFAHERGWTLQLALRPPGGADRPIASTGSYDIAVVSRAPTAGGPEDQLLQAIVASIRRNDPRGPTRPGAAAPDAGTEPTVPPRPATSPQAPQHDAGRPAPSAEAIRGLLAMPDGSPFDPGPGWTMEEPRISPDDVSLTFVHERGWRIQVVIRGKQEGEKQEGVEAKTTKSFTISTTVRGEDPRSPERRLFERVVEAIGRNDKGQVRLAVVEATVTAPFANGLFAQLGALGTLDALQVVLTLVLLLLGLAALALVGRHFAGALGGIAGADRAATVGLLGVGAALRLALPIRLVTIFMGYRAALEVVQFAAVPKYGASVFVLRRVAFGLFGPHHDVMVWLNIVLGVLTIPVLTALAARLRPGRWTATAVAALLALTPLFVKDHLSESNLVPLVFFLSCGLLLWDVYLERHRRLELAGALVFFVLTMTGRPETLVIVPLAALLFLWARGFREGLRGQAPWIVVFVLALAALVVPHVFHLVYAIEYEVLTDGIPAVDTSLLTRTVRGFLSRNVLLEPTLYPLAYPILALGAVVFATGRERRLPLALFVVALAWIGTFFIDLPAVSVARLNAPAGTLVAVAAGLAIAGVVRWATRPGAPLVQRLGGAVLLPLLVAGSFVPSALRLWTPTNEDEEETFLKEAYAALPTDQTGCLVRIDGRDDPVLKKIHRYHPDYLAQPPHRRLQVLGIREWERAGRTCPGGGPSWFLLSLRCYAMRADELADPKSRPVMLSSCERTMNLGSLRTVVEREAPNHGDNEFGYYPAVKSFRLGLYEVGEDVR